MFKTILSASIVTLLLVGCKRETEVKAPPLNTITKLIQVDFYNNIPYLMMQKNIDTVLFVVSKGEMGGGLTKGDTSGIYIRVSPFQINRHLKSIMCCYNEYLYDSLGLLMEETEFTDYTMEYRYQWEAIENNIYKIKQDQYNDIDTTFYKLNNARVISKQYTTENEQLFKAFHYTNGQLSSTSEARNSDENPNFKSTTEYDWNGPTLSKIHEYYATDNAIRVQFFDDTSFPCYEAFISNGDTLVEMSIIRK